MKFVLLLATALVLSACATTATDNKSSSTHEEKQYRIGSRIPVKDSVGASPTATMDSSALSNLPPRPAN